MSEIDGNGPGCLEGGQAKLVAPLLYKPESYAKRRQRKRGGIVWITFFVDVRDN